MDFMGLLGDRAPQCTAHAELPGDEKRSSVATSGPPVRYAERHVSGIATAELADRAILGERSDRRDGCQVSVAYRRYA